MYFSACARQALLAFAPHVIRREEGLKISEATLDGWMSGSSEMPETMLRALAHLLVKLAGSARDPGQD